MTRPAPICTAQSLACTAPEFFATLTDAEIFVLQGMPEFWERPDQHVPGGDWRSFGFIGGRGFGKTYAIATWINAEIEAGRVRRLGLIAPTIDRVDEIQIENLIRTAPPWFKPVRARGTIVWPNGVQAEVHSAEAPGSARGSEFDLLWLTEIVAWSPTTRDQAFMIITVACRAGRSQFVWDTTSRGRNSVIRTLVKAAKDDPSRCILVQGSMLDNPLLTEKYIRDTCQKLSGQELQEEVHGRVFDGADGALWSQQTIDETRVERRPERPELTLIAVDPALSTDPSADETGIVFGDRGRDGQSYVWADKSGRHTIEEWTTIVVDQCEIDAAGVIIERNRLGEHAAHGILSLAKTRGIECITLKPAEPFPSRRRGVIYIREVVARDDKGARAQGPAAEYKQTRAHLVGSMMGNLETQMTTFVPGLRGQKSPNNFDAHAHLVNELADLERGRPGERAKENARQAGRVQAELQTRLLAAARGRGVGL
jgi:phage terminase large subunit-like protein